MRLIQVKLEERDYVNGARAASSLTKSAKQIIAIASAVVLVGALFGWRAGYERESFIGCFICVGILVGAWVGRRVSVAATTKRLFAQQKALQRPYEVGWDATGVTMKSQDATAMTRWADVHKWHETNDQFLLFLSDAHFLMIPKRTFENESQIRDFRNHVAKSVPQR